MKKMEILLCSTILMASASISQAESNKPDHDRITYDQYLQSNDFEPQRKHDYYFLPHFITTDLYNFSQYNRHYLSTLLNDSSSPQFDIIEDTKSYNYGLEDILDQNHYSEKIISKDQLSYFKLADIKQSYLNDLEDRIRNQDQSIRSDQTYKQNKSEELSDIKSNITSLSSSIDTLNQQIDNEEQEIKTAFGTLNRKKNQIIRNIGTIKERLSGTRALSQDKSRIGTELEKIEKKLFQKIFWPQPRREGVIEKAVRDIKTRLQTIQERTDYRTRSNADTDQNNKIHNSELGNIRILVETINRSDQKDQIIQRVEEIKIKLSKTKASLLDASMDLSAEMHDINSQLDIIEETILTDRTSQIQEIQFSISQIKSELRNFYLNGRKNEEHNAELHNIEIMLDKINQEIRDIDLERLQQIYAFLDNHRDQLDKEKETFTLKEKEKRNIEREIEQVKETIQIAIKKKSDLEEFKNKISDHGNVGILYTVYNQDKEGIAYSQNKAYKTLLEDVNGEIVLDVEAVIKDLVQNSKAYGLSNKTYQDYVNPYQSPLLQYVWKAPGELSKPALRILKKAEQDRLTSYKIPAIQSKYAYTGLTQFHNGFSNALGIHDITIKNKKTAVFGDISYQKINEKMQKDRIGYDGQIKYLKAGVIRKLNDHFFIGSAVGADIGQFEYANNKGRMDTKTAGIAILSGIQNSLFTLTGALSYHKNSYDLERNTNLNNKIIFAKTNGTTIGASLEARTKFSYKAVSLEPFARYRIATVSINGYEEYGLDYLNTIVDPQKNKLSELEFGGALELKAERFHLKLQASMINPAGENMIQTSSVLANNFRDIKYKHETLYLDKTRFNTGISLNYILKPGTSLRFEALKNFDKTNKDNWQAGIRLLSQF